MRELKLVLIDLEKKIKSINKNKEIAIFGTGSFARNVYKVLNEEDFKIINFFDNNEKLQGNKLFDIEILSPSLIKKEVPLIIASTWANEICKQLENKDINLFMLDPWFETFNLKIETHDIKLINNLYNKLSDNLSKEVLISILEYRLNGTQLLKSNYEQYFHPKVKPEDNDILIDGGSYNGDTIRSLNSKDINLEVHCFEPDVKNYNLLVEESKKSRFTVKTNKLGLWDKEETLKFLSTEMTVGYGCKIEEEGDISIETTSIDSYCKSVGIKPTYIKLDVEGAEREVIMGSVKTIKEYKPKLAISLYHKYTDLWELPFLIEEIESSYEFYLGHHRDNWFETILYALPKNK